MAAGRAVARPSGGLTAGRPVAAASGPVVRHASTSRHRPARGRRPAPTPDGNAPRRRPLALAALAALALAALAALALAAPASASAADCPGADLTPALQGVAAAKAATLCLVNAQRAAQGVAPVASESHLDRASQRYAELLVARSFFAP